MRRSLALAVTSAAALVAAAPASAVTFTAGTYSENFNTLAASATGSLAALPAGFTVTEGGGNANTTYTAGTGSSQTGDTYSFGSAGSTDRALGNLRSGSLSSRIDALFTNGTGGTVSSLTVGYTGELWRLGTAGGRTDRLDFSYSLDGTTYTAFDALDFTTPNTSGTVGLRDGNLAANRSVLSSVLDVSLADGASIYFRWTDLDATDADDGLAIDDFNLTPTLAATPAVPEPATWGLMILGFGLVGSTLRHRQRVTAVTA